MKPIQLDFKPSITLMLIICTMGLGATAILILPTFLWQLKLLLGIGIFASATYAVCQYGLLVMPWSCVALTVSNHNQLTLVLANGRQLSAQLSQDSVVSPYLTVVNCKVKDAPPLLRLFVRYVVILPDMLDAETYRQLRVWLRWGMLGNI